MNSAARRKFTIDAAFAFVVLVICGFAAVGVYAIARGLARLLS